MYVPNISMSADQTRVEFTIGGTTLSWKYTELNEKAGEIILCILKASADERITGIKRDETKITEIIKHSVSVRNEVEQS